MFLLLCLGPVCVDGCPQDPGGRGETLVGGARGTRFCCRGARAGMRGTVRLRCDRCTFRLPCPRGPFEKPRGRRAFMALDPPLIPRQGSWCVWLRPSMLCSARVGSRPPSFPVGLNPKQRREKCHSQCSRGGAPSTQGGGASAPAQDSWTSPIVGHSCGEKRGSGAGGRGHICSDDPGLQ